MSEKRTAKKKKTTENKSEKITDNKEALNAETNEAAENNAEVTNENEAAEVAEAAEEKLSIKSVIKIIKGFILGIDYSSVIMRAIGSYFLIMAYFLFKFKDKINPLSEWQKFIEKMPLGSFIGLVFIAFVLITSIHDMFKKKTNVSAASLFVGALTLSFVFLWKSENYYFCIAFIFLSAIAAWFCYNYDGFKFVEYLPKKTVYAVIILFTVCMAVFISVFTICKHIVGWTATYDFGLFLQMYHYMAETFEPLTTCERDKLLSHFAVHFSPIYYLILPFYYIFPSANTLLISQAVLAVIGAIPLMLICKNRNLSNLETISFSVVFLFCCAIVGPCFYDFHENAFLPAILMWFFYAIEKKKTVLMYIFFVLLLFVKEDAALYAALIGLYCFFNMEKKHHGLIMFSVSVFYFVIVTGLMTKFGEGVMTSRTYGNLMIDYDAGLGEVVKTVLINPTYFLTQCISEESFRFFLIMLLPLGFMPILSKKFSHYFLVAPFILMNLASGYVYAKNIDFQYVFGTSACLIYCALVNYNDIKAKNKQFVPVFMSVATLCSFSTMLGGKTNSYDMYKKYKEEYQRRDSLLDVIPDDASVAVFDSFLLCHIAQREEVYLLSDAYLNKPIDTDFVVIKSGYNDQWLLDEINIIERNGYKKYGAENSLMTIYVSPEYKGVKNNGKQAG